MHVRHFECETISFVPASVHLPVSQSNALLLLQLAEAIKGNTSLKLLDIGGNNIGPEGIKALLESLRGNETLTTLELGYNPIGEEGAKHLADVIKYDLSVSASALFWLLGPQPMQQLLLMSFLATFLSIVPQP